MMRLKLNSIQFQDAICTAKRDLDAAQHSHNHLEFFVKLSFFASFSRYAISNMHMACNKVEDAFTINFHYLIRSELLIAVEGT